MHNIELQDHVRSVSEVLRQQPFALLEEVALVLHPVAQCNLLGCTLNNILHFVLVLAVNLNR